MLIALFAVVVFFGIAAVLIGNAYENGFAAGRASREEEITLLENEAYDRGFNDGCDRGYHEGWCNAWRSRAWDIKGF